MPKHTPIRFESSFNPTFRRLLLQSIKENGTAKTVMNALLAIVALDGVFSLGALPPNARRIFERVWGSTKEQQRQRYQQLWRSFYKLRKERLLQFYGEKEGYALYRPNMLGMKRMKKFLYDELSLATPRHWDGKWRLVFFDIPEERKRDRDALRTKLGKLGFYQCQKSVWIHPFPCLEEIEFLKEMIGIKPYVKMFTVIEMDDGKTLYFFRDLLKRVV